VEGRKGGRKKTGGGGERVFVIITKSNKYYKLLNCNQVGLGPDMYLNCSLIQTVKIESANKLVISL